MMKEEDQSRENGQPLKRILMNPETIKDMKHVIQVVVNPSDRKSKKADKQEIRDEYQLYAQNPIFDQAWAAKLLLSSFGRDTEEGVAEQPQQQSQPPQQSTPQGPEMPPGGPQTPQMSNQPFGAPDAAQNAQNKMAQIYGA